MIASFETPWVQSLLILSPRIPPGVDQLVADLQRRFGEVRLHTEEREGMSESEVPTEDGTITLRAHWARSTTSGAVTLADLAREEPFWPALWKHTLLHVIGHEVVVADLPARVRFVIHCIVRTVDPKAISCEIRGPYGAPHSPTKVFALPEQILPVEHLHRPDVTAAPPICGFATLQQAVAPVFQRAGLYHVGVNIDGKEAAHAPLVVRLANQ
jgi:hypothetical protein